MMPQLATFSALRVGMKVPLMLAEPGVSQFRLLSKLSVLMVVGEEGQGVVGFELGGLELELSLEPWRASPRGLLRAAWRGERVLVWRKAVLESDWERIGDIELPFRLPDTEEILGENTELSSSSGPSRVRGRPLFFFSSPLMLTKPPMLLFSWPPPLPAEPPRPIIVMGGGPELSRDTVGLGPGLGFASDFSWSSPETSARPFTFRFSAVFSREERRSCRYKDQP